MFHITRRYNILGSHSLVGFCTWIFMDVKD